MPRFTLGSQQNNYNSIEEKKERRISDFSSESSSHQRQLNEREPNLIGNAMVALANQY